MRTFVFSALALGAMAFPALADPVTTKDLTSPQAPSKDAHAHAANTGSDTPFELTDSELDTVTAGTRLDSLTQRNGAMEPPTAAGKPYIVIEA